MKKVLLTIFAAVLCFAACAQKAPKSIKLLEPSFDEGMTLMQALKERNSSGPFKYYMGFAWRESSGWTSHFSDRFKSPGNRAVCLL